MDYNDAYSDIGKIKDFRDMQIRTLNNSVKVLEYMLQQKNDEITELKRKIDSMLKIFIGQ